MSRAVGSPAQPPAFIDTHAHLGGYGAELPEVLARAKKAGVWAIVAVGTDSASSKHALDLARAGSGRDQWPQLAVSAGLHPHDASRSAVEMPVLAELLAAAIAEGMSPSVGETGLDYYRDLSPRQAQRAAFWAHIELAHKLSLPLVIHDRDAHADVLAMLRGGAPFPAGGVMHCFSGDMAMAEACLSLGLAISFAGPLTFPRSEEARAIARAIPADALLVETDCPYLAPVPYRGKRNEPAYVVHTTTALAAARNEQLDETATALSRNARRLWFRRHPNFTR